jgi:hypothetical protein
MLFLLDLLAGEVVVQNPPNPSLKKVRNWVNRKRE